MWVTRRRWSCLGFCGTVQLLPPFVVPRPAMLVLRYAFWLFAKLALWLGYRVEVRGLEQVRGLEGPVLILPNHPGYVDPPLVLSVLWPLLKPRPMVFADMFANPVLYPLLKILNGLEIPDLEQASVEA